MAFPGLRHPGRQHEKTLHGDVLAQDLHLLPLFCRKRAMTAPSWENHCSHNIPLYSNIQEETKSVCLYINIFCFQFGIHDLLLGIKAGIAGKHI